MRGCRINLPRICKARTEFRQCGCRTRQVEERIGTHRWRWKMVHTKLFFLPHPVVPSSVAQIRNRRVYLFLSDGGAKPGRSLQTACVCGLDMVFGLAAAPPQWLLTLAMEIVHVLHKKREGIIRTKIYYAPTKEFRALTGKRFLT